MKRGKELDAGNAAAGGVGAWGVERRRPRLEGAGGPG
jgi:hypothetical protein